MTQEAARLYRELGHFHHLTRLIFVGKVSSFEEEDGTGTGRNEVRIKLSRGDLGSQFTCQAENEAIDQPLSTSVQVDVNRKSLYYNVKVPHG